jgi:hypothetical protein
LHTRCVRAIVQLKSTQQLYNPAAEVCETDAFLRILQRLHGGRGGHVLAPRRPGRVTVRESVQCVRPVLIAGVGKGYEYARRCIPSAVGSSTRDDGWFESSAAKLFPYGSRCSQANISRCSQAKHCVNMKRPGWEENQCLIASPALLRWFPRSSALLLHVWRGQRAAWQTEPQYGTLHIRR